MNGDAIRIIEHINKMIAPIYEKLDEINDKFTEKSHEHDRVLDNHSGRIENVERDVKEKIPVTFKRMNNEIGSWKRKIIIIGIVVVVLVLVTIGAEKAAGLLKYLF